VKAEKSKEILLPHRLPYSLFIYWRDSQK